MYYLTVLEVQESQMDGQVCFLLEGLGGESNFLLFQLPEIAFILWFMTIHHSNVSFHCNIYFSNTDPTVKRFLIRLNPSE